MTEIIKLPNIDDMMRLGEVSHDEEFIYIPKDAYDYSVHKFKLEKLGFVEYDERVSAYVFTPGYRSRLISLLHSFEKDKNGNILSSKYLYMLIDAYLDVYFILVCESQNPVYCKLDITRI